MMIQRLNYCYIQISLILLTVACSSPTMDGEPVNNELKLIDSVTFQVPFSYSPNHSARFYDEDLDKELLYFADLKTQKEVLFFSLDGTLHYKVKLDSGINSLDKNVQDLEVISLDTIVLLSNYSNRLVIINREGSVWKTANLNDALGLSEDTIKSYEFISSLTNSSALINKHDIILFVDHIMNRNQFSSLTDAALANIKSSWKSKQLIRINGIGTDSLSHNLGGALYQAISPQDSSPYIIPLFKSYTVLPNAIYYTSLFSDKVFVLDPENLSIINEKTIESDYSSFGTPIYTAGTLEEQNHASKKVSEHFKSSGKLGRISYNPHKKHFYLSATISKSADQAGKWLLMIYDEEFQKIKEFLIDTKKYLGPLEVTENGFMLRKNLNIENYNEQRVEMYEFTY